MSSWIELAARLGRLGRPAPPTDAVTIGAEAYWNRQALLRDSLYWAEHPLVREYVNSLVTGLPGLWPIGALKAMWTYRTLDRGVSIGCGTGNLERDLRHRSVCRKIDAFDVSAASVRQATRLARQQGVRGIRYRSRDCNRLELPTRSYDIAFFHQSLHHISDPDGMLERVSGALKPGGLLYLDEYVGPSRGEWTDETIRHARAVHEQLDSALRLQPVAPPIPLDDPSEISDRAASSPLSHSASTSSCIGRTGAICCSRCSAASTGARS